MENEAKEKGTEGMIEYLRKEDVRRAVLHNEGEAVIAAIDALPVTELQDWIPVTERLPENEDEVLVIWECNYWDGYRVSTDFYNPRAGRWDLDDYQYTHWMPLPQPPEGKQ